MTDSVKSAVAAEVPAENDSDPGARAEAQPEARPAERTSAEHHPADKPASPRSEKTGKKTFTAESGLGFMRVIQIFNILYILFTLLIMVFATHSTLTADLTVFIVCSVIVLLLQSMIVFFIAKRYERARVVIPCLYFAQFFCNLIAAASTGGLDAATAVTELITPVLMTIYFRTSRRAKAVLVRPLKIGLLDEDVRAQRVMWNPKSPDFWMRLAIYFFVFSIVGHWMERGVQILVKYNLFPGTRAAPDSLTYLDYWNPFPIYGIAVVICGLALYPLFLKLREKCPHAWQAYAISFIVNGIFCTIAELILGFCFNADHSAWDYSNQFLNFEGQICLLYTLAFAVMSSLITWLVYPLMEHLFSYVSRDAFRIIFVLSLVFYIFIFFTYNIDIERIIAQNEAAATASP